MSFQSELTQKALQYATYMIVQQITAPWQILAAEIELATLQSETKVRYDYRY